MQLKIFFLPIVATGALRAAAFGAITPYF